MSVKHKGFKILRGDASNPTFGIAVGETSHALHIVEASDAGTDWNVAADTNPAVYIHSATSPATEYIKMHHDAVTAHLDGVGASKIKLSLSGTESVSIAASGVLDLAGQTLTAVNASGSTSMITWLAALGAGADGSDDEDPTSAIAIKVAGTTAYVPCFATI